MRMPSQAKQQCWSGQDDRSELPISQCIHVSEEHYDATENVYHFVQIFCVHFNTLVTRVESCPT